jgi:class 3 adenylate cyclase
MADRTAGIAEDRRIAFRIGINLGDILVEGDDIFGDGVNVAARLQEIAAPGGIWMSSRVHEDMRDRLDTALTTAASRCSSTSLDRTLASEAAPEVPAVAGAAAGRRSCIHMVPAGDCIRRWPSTSPGLHFGSPS